MSSISHPVHLLNSGSTSFSALIPFCAFQARLGISEPKMWVENISFPVCNSFRPVALEGQLCYSLKVGRKSDEGKSNGLMLLLDLNEDRSIQLELNQHKEGGLNRESMNLDTKMSHKGKDPKIHIKTLSSYRGFGEGSYKMTMLKALKGTNDFLAMSEEERNCAVEDFEECRNKKLTELCQCVPWELSAIQVKAMQGKHYQQTFFSRRVQYALSREEIALN